MFSCTVMRHLSATLGFDRGKLLHLVVTQSPAADIVTPRPDGTDISDKAVRKTT